MKWWPSGLISTHSPPISTLDLVLWSHVRFPWLPSLLGAYRAFHLLSYFNVLKWKFTSRKNITHDLISIHYSPISSHLHQQAALSWAISHLSLADMDPKLMPLLIDANSITWSKIKTKKAHKNCTWKSVCLSLCFLHDLEHQTEGFFFQLHCVQVLVVFMLFLHATKQLSNYANTICLLIIFNHSQENEHTWQNGFYQIWHLLYVWR